ncbi:MAG: hypothetical protein ACM3QU_16355 [Verrucomicrobiota bacterium]
MTRILALLTATLVAVGTACAAASPTTTRATVTTRAPLRIGAVVPELLDPSLQASTVALMTSANLADSARVTVTWERTQTAIDDGLLSDLRNGVDTARAAGIDVYLDAYPADSSQTPRTAAEQARFATWLAGVVTGIPGLEHVIVGNEPNLNLFWSPQFGPAGQDAAAAGYERLLARTYDAVKRVAPQVEIVGGTLAHSGTNKRGTGRDTHSPSRFILDMGAAYRASRRIRPIMDAFSYHPYMERSDLPPTFRHNPVANTVTIADYGKLISLLERAFGGTRQKGETLPLVYDEFGVEAKIPAAYASHYTGSEPATTHPVSEATQARYYADGMHLAACQPTVRTFMVFRLIDQPALADWQSGVYYADRKTPKSSRAAVAAAAGRYRSRRVAGCAALLAPKPLVDWKRRVLTCDADCAYTETFRRVGTGGPVATIRDRTRASIPTRLPRARLKPGRYRIVLRVTATAYKANAFTAVSPVFG